MDAIIFDIDGTLANIDHRLHHVRGEHVDWDTFFATMRDDTPNHDVCWIAEVLASERHTSKNVNGEADFDIFVCSGRPDDYRQDTETWLQEKIPHLFDEVEAVLMRSSGDYRSDVVVKREMLHNIRGQCYNVRFVVDDRQCVVDMWREEGVTCLQCAPGDFDTKKPDVQPGFLHVLIGPSGAGKSHYARESFSSEWIVSSDGLRKELCGDFIDQSKNDEVFTALYAIVKTRIEHGLVTIVDSTNIRDKDRKVLLDLVPENGQIIYHVIDRPMEEKQRDAEWRADVMVKGVPLMEKHDQVFQSNLKRILAGDGDPRVTVMDHRR